MKISKRAVCHYGLISVSLLLSQIANGDILVLKNGDRITGDIKRIWDAEVTIEPEYSDEFAVDVSAIGHIESERSLEIKLKNGRNVVARLAGADEDGNQILEYEGQSVVVSLGRIFELNEPEKDFEWDSNVEFSADFDSGNTESYNTKLKADTTVKIRDHRHLADVTFFS